PAGPGLVAAVAFDPSGAPRACNQYVPAPAIGGYSLDEVRRAPDVPADLTDLLLVTTIGWLRARGRRALGLNITDRDRAEPYAPTWRPRYVVSDRRRFLSARRAETSAPGRQEARPAGSP